MKEKKYSVLTYELVELIYSNKQPLSSMPTFDCFKTDFLQITGFELKIASVYFFLQILSVSSIFLYNFYF